MSTRSKRILAWMLAVAMVLTIMPVSLIADGVDYLNDYGYDDGYVDGYVDYDDGYDVDVDYGTNDADAIVCDDCYDDYVCQDCYDVLDDDYYGGDSDNDYGDYLYFDVDDPDENFFVPFSTGASAGLTRITLTRLDGANPALNWWMTQSGTAPTEINMVNDTITFPGDANYNGLTLQHNDGNIANAPIREGMRVVVRGTTTPGYTMMLMRNTGYASQATGVAADVSGNFEIVWDVSGDPVGNYTIRHNHGFAGTVPFTITEIWWGTFGAALLDPQYRMGGTPGNLDSVRAANAGNVGWDMRTLSNDQRNAHFAGRNNRFEVVQYNGIMIATNRVGTDGGPHDSAGGWGWGPLTVLRTGMTNVNPGDTVHITGRIGNNGGAVAHNSVWGIRNIASDAIQGWGTPSAPISFTIDFEVPATIDNVEIIWNIMNADPWPDSLAGFAVSIDDMVVVSSADPYVSERSSLNTEISEALLRVQGAYIPATWTPFALALSAAQTAHADTDPGAGGRMDVARTALEGYMSALTRTAANQGWTDIIASDFVGNRGGLTLTLTSVEGGIHVTGRTADNEGLLLDLDLLRNTYETRTGNAPANITIQGQVAQASSNLMLQAQAVAGGNTSVNHNDVAAQGSFELIVLPAIANVAPTWTTGLPFITTQDGLFGDFLITGIQVGSLQIADLLVRPIDIAAIGGVTVPAYGDPPSATGSGGMPQWTATIAWFNAAGVAAGAAFSANTVYEARITITPEDGWTLDGVAGTFFTVAGATSVSRAGNLVTAVFPQTAEVQPNPITSLTIGGITPPVVNVAPGLTVPADAGGQWTATIAWFNNATDAPAGATFSGGVVYRAEITIAPATTPAPGFTLTGVANPGFVVTGAPPATRDGVNVTVVFPVTAAAPITALSIGGVALPANGAVPTAVGAVTGGTVGGVSQWTAASIQWFPGATGGTALGAGASFSGEQVYRAVITITPTVPGWTLDGVTAAFTVAGATSVTRADNVITAVFPATLAFAWLGSPITATTTLPGATTEIFRLSNHIGTDLPDNIQAAGPATLTVSDGSIAVTGRDADWHSVDIMIGASGFNLQPGDQVTVVGRVANVTPLPDANILLGGSFPENTPGVTNRWPWLHNIGIQTLTGAFTLRHTIGADTPTQPLLAYSPIRIQTNGGGAVGNQLPFIIDDILITRPGGPPPPGFDFQTWLAAQGTGLLNGQTGDNNGAWPFWNTGGNNLSVENVGGSWQMTVPGSTGYPHYGTHGVLMRLTGPSSLEVQPGYRIEVEGYIRGTLNPSAMFTVGVAFRPGANGGDPSSNLVTVPVPTGVPDQPFAISRTITAADVSDAAAAAHWSNFPTLQLVRQPSQFGPIMVITDLRVIPGAPPAPPAQTLTSNARSTNNTRVNGFDWELWTQFPGGVEMNIYPSGAFTGEWTDTFNSLFRVGRAFPASRAGTRISDIGDITLSYVTEEYTSTGTSYLTVYGWTRGTEEHGLIEWYIMENFNPAHWYPSVARGYTHHGTVTLNGGVYDIFTNWRVEQPSIEGTQTFLQIFSVRQDRRLSGTIDVSAHFAAWEDLIGLQTHAASGTTAHFTSDLLLTEVSFTVEGFGGTTGSSGFGRVTALCIVYGENAVCTARPANTCANCSVVYLPTPPPPPVPPTPPLPPVDPPTAPSVGGGGGHAASRPDLPALPPGGRPSGQATAGRPSEAPEPPETVPGPPRPGAPETREIHFTLQLDEMFITCHITDSRIYMDVAPLVVDGRTLVPVRFVAYALGARVYWNARTREVTLVHDGNVLVFAIGEIAPGMDVPAEIIGGRTMVPIRFISEFFGAEVDWDAITRTIEVRLV